MNQTKFYPCVSCVLLLTSLSLGQEKKKTEKNEPPFSRPPKLELAFEDKFENDTSGDYEIEKDVTWEKGKLVLGNGSKLHRNLNEAGPWVEMKIDLKFPELTEDGQESELKIWLDLDDVTDSFVQFRQTHEKGKTRSEISIVDSDGNWNEGSELFLVKEPPTMSGHLQNGEWSISYRYGLWRVQHEKDLVVFGQIENGSAGINGVNFQNNVGRVDLNQIRLEHSNRIDSTLSPAQESKLDATEKLADQVFELYGNGEFSKAAKLAQKVTDVRCDLLGKFDIEFAYTLDNLAELYRSMNDLETATLRYREATRIKEILVGKEHLDYAIGLTNLARIYDELTRYQDSEKLYFDALNIQKKVLGIKHPEYANCLTQLAVHFELIGSYEQAESYLLNAKKIRQEVLGEEHVDFAASLNDLALFYHKRGDLKKAEIMYLEVRRVTKTTLGEDHLNYATCLSNLGNLKKSKDDFHNAKSFFTEALKIIENALGKENVDYASSLADLGEVYMRLGEVEKGESLYLQALEINRKLLGNENLGYAQSLNNIGFLYKLVGEWEKAEGMYIEALKIRKKVLGDAHPDCATSLNNLAELKFALGEIEQAETMHREALQIRRKAFGRNHPEYAESLINLANLYENTGLYKKAEQLLREAEETSRNTVGRDSQLYVNCLTHLAGLYHTMGEFEKAEPLQLEAKQIIQRLFGKGSLTFARILSELGRLYHSMEEYEKAKSLFSEALAIRKMVLGKEHLDYVATLNDLGVIFSHLGLNEKAREMLIEAIRIRGQQLGETHPDYATSLNNLATVYFSSGDYKKAEPLFLEVRKIVENSYGKEHSVYASCLNNLAECYSELTEFERAEPLYLEAKRITEQNVGDEHPDYATSLKNLAGLYHLMGDYEKSNSLFQACIKIKQNNSERYSSIQTEFQQLEYQNTIDDELSGYLSVAQHIPGEASKPFEIIVEMRGATQLRQKQYREIENQAETRGLFFLLRDISQQLYVHLGKDRASANWNIRLQDLTNKKNEIEKELAAKSSMFRHKTTSIRLNEIQDSLPAHTAYVLLQQYTHWDWHQTEKKFVGSDRLLAFVVHKTGYVQMINLGESESIFQTVKDWRTCITSNVENGSKFRDYRPLASILQKRLWQPIEKRFQHNVKTVLISPDGELGTLPFAALPGKTKDRFLVNEYQIATIPVPKLLGDVFRIDETQTKITNVLFVGNVDYSNSNQPSSDSKLVAPNWRGSTQILEGDWSPLENTGKEVDAIRRLMIRTKSIKSDLIQVLQKQDASEANFRQSARKANILHVATHGFFADPKFETDLTASKRKALKAIEPEREIGHSRSHYQLRNPGILSGLVFAGANQKDKEAGADDGIMTADEISFLPLNEVDLVALSACETGLGQAAGGEGLIGIQRAFQISGARTTVASLWKVNDLATRKLMERFYRNMFEKKMSKLEALTEAQRWLLNHPEQHPEIGRGKRPLTKDKSQIKIRKGTTNSAHPRYWAAWVLSGDWR